MKNPDSLVLGFEEKSFAELIKEYKMVENKIQKYKPIKEKYEKLIKGENEDKESDQLSFKEQWEIYSIIKSLTKRKTGDYKYSGIDLFALEERLERVFPDITTYNRLIDEIDQLETERELILTDIVDFSEFVNDNAANKYTCWGNHLLVRFPDELKCIRCGATTKDYNIKGEELDIVTLSAEIRRIVLKDITEKDLPFLQVQLENEDNNREKRRELERTLDENSDDYMAKVEEILFNEPDPNENIKLQIKIARLLDSQKYDNKAINIRNPKYLSEEKEKEVLEKVKKDYEEIKNSDSRFKELMLEECKTVKYEILILSGAHLPTLMKQAQNEDEKDALVKAYYNISNKIFRINSEYFGSNDKDAIYYDCLTADPEINSRLLDMKIKR